MFILTSSICTPEIVSGHKSRTVADVILHVKRHKCADAIKQKRGGLFLIKHIATFINLFSLYFCCFYIILRNKVEAA